MRNWLPLLAALTIAVVAGALLFGGTAPSDPEEILPGPDPDEQELRDNPHLLVKTGTLVIRARAADGTVPFGTEVGYDTRKGPKLYYAGEDGVRRLADAPLGPIEIIVRAEGYEEVRQRRELIAGVPMEVILVLKPARE